MGGRTIKCIWHCFLVDKGSDRYLSPIQALAFVLACIWRRVPIWAFIDQKAVPYAYHITVCLSHKSNSVAVQWLPDLFSCSPGQRPAEGRTDIPDVVWSSAGRLPNDRDIRLNQPIIGGGWVEFVTQALTVKIRTRPLRVKNLYVIRRCSSITPLRMYFHKMFIYSLFSLCWHPLNFVFTFWYVPYPTTVHWSGIPLVRQIYWIGNNMSLETLSRFPIPVCFLRSFDTF